MEQEYNDNVFVNDSSLYNQKTDSVPAGKKDIGIDVDNEFNNDILMAGESSTLDMQKLQSFLQISQNRDQIYQLLDTMSNDPTIAAVLETYAEDSTETNEDGHIVWCQSDDPHISKFVTYLLDTMNVDKNSYKWVYSLCKYGDLYLRLYRRSDIQSDLFADEQRSDERKKLNEEFNKIGSHEDELNNEKLNEDIHVVMYDKNDNYVHYMSQVANPAEMFELTQFGKSYAYIQAKTPVTRQAQQDASMNNYFRYQFQKNDVLVYDATNFVHASLEDNSGRIPEEVQIFIGKDKKSDESGNESSLKYEVRRGQSLLYNTFKVWREMTLLENSLLLNRLTKSSIVRIVGVEVGDMDKTKVGPKLMQIKNMIEQKTAINTGDSMSEYTNPGPMENNIYVPTNNGKGAISLDQLGGDVDVKGLGDVDYFTNKLFGSLRVPKQYFSNTDDSTGFNGGTSLSIISSRYAKMIKRIQNTYLQALTDAVNLMLLDKGLNSYVNNFELHMMPPTTQEEIDRRDNESSRIQMIGDIMSLLDNIDDGIVKTKALKIMLSNVIHEPEVIDLISSYIDELEENGGAISDTENTDDMNLNFSSPSSTSDMPLDGFESDADFDAEFENEEPGESEETEEETVLPTPAELNAGDFTDSNNPEFES